MQTACRRLPAYLSSRAFMNISLTRPRPTLVTSFLRSGWDQGSPVSAEWAAIGSAKGSVRLFATPPAGEPAATPSPTSNPTSANAAAPNPTTATPPNLADSNPTSSVPRNPPAPDPAIPNPSAGPAGSPETPPQQDEHRHNKLKMGRLARLFDRLLSRPVKDADMRRLAAQSLALGTYGVVLASALGTAGVDTKPILTAVGASSVVVGFALKDAATNYLAGLSLVLQKPFEAGDTITVLNFTGKVLAIDYRYVHLEHNGGGDASKFVALPSALVYASPIVVVPGNRRKAPVKP
eukprot:jgi/Mesvir1/24267/Mv10968-RA.1